MLLEYNSVDFIYMVVCTILRAICCATNNCGGRPAVVRSGVACLVPECERPAAPILCTLLTLDKSFLDACQNK